MPPPLCAPPMSTPLETSLFQNPLPSISSGRSSRSWGAGDTERLRIPWTTLALHPSSCSLGLPTWRPQHARAGPVSFDTAQEGAPSLPRPLLTSCPHPCRGHRAPFASGYGWGAEPQTWPWGPPCVALGLSLSLSEALLPPCPPPWWLAEGLWVSLCSSLLSFLVCLPGSPPC